MTSGNSLGRITHPLLTHPLLTKAVGHASGRISVAGKVRVLLRPCSLRFSAWKRSHRSSKNIIPSTYPYRVCHHRPADIQSVSTTHIHRLGWQHRQTHHDIASGRKTRLRRADHGSGRRVPLWHASHRIYPEESRRHVETLFNYMFNLH